MSKRKPKLCFESDGTWPIRLEQTGKDRFTVVYGAEVTDGLIYSEAAFRLGCAIMHRAACDNKLDNRREYDNAI